MKHQREAAAVQAVSLSLSLGAVAGLNKKMRRATAAATGGDQFLCKTCGRSFPSFQALGGHRTSHLRARHGLALALTAGDQYFSVNSKGTTPQKKKKTSKGTNHKSEHRCHICSQGFETGQALEGHMRRHRDEAAQPRPVLLEQFV